MILFCSYTGDHVIILLIVHLMNSVDIMLQLFLIKGRVEIILIVVTMMILFCHFHDD